MKTILQFAAVAAISLSLAAPVLAGDVSPEQVAGATTVDTAQARALFDKEVAFVDVRRTATGTPGASPAPSTST